VGANAAFRHDSAESRGIPAVLCAGRHRTTGEPCKNFAMVGAVVCSRHGATGSVRAKADRTVTLARLMARDPRPINLILADVLRDADAAYLHARIPLLDDEHAATADELLRHSQSMDRLVTYVRAIVATKAWGIYLEKQQAQLAKESRVIFNVITAGVAALDLTLDEDQAATLKTAIMEALSVESGRVRDPYNIQPESEPDPDTAEGGHGYACPCPVCRDSDAQPALEAAPADVVEAVVTTEPASREPVTEVEVLTRATPWEAPVTSHESVPDYLSEYRAADAWVRVL